MRNGDATSPLVSPTLYRYIDNMIRSQWEKENSVYSTGICMTCRYSRRNRFWEDYTDTPISL